MARHWIHPLFAVGKTHRNSKIVVTSMRVSRGLSTFYRVLFTFMFLTSKTAAAAAVRGTMHRRYSGCPLAFAALQAWKPIRRRVVKKLQLDCRQNPNPFESTHRPSTTQRLQFHSSFSAFRISSAEDEKDRDIDTIFALSSGAASSSPTAVAVIRITGPQSHNVLQSLLKPNSQLPPPRQAALRTLIDPSDDSPLDQALVLLFQAPHSFTGEDVVELHCHGSRAVVQGVLQCLSANPATRMAERGEFTQRAFARGKLDLLKVEALADLLTADTQKQRQQALRQLEGRLSRQYNEWRKVLIKGLAHAEAVIDFGDDEQLVDDDVGFDHHGQESVWGAVGENMSLLKKQMQLHLKDSYRGQLVREGVRIAIVGPPNAGKSSLFNLLAKRDAAIVSPIAGTTRDVLELTLDLGGVRCTLSDTAGMRLSSQDVIEQEGIKRARHVARQAHITVAMVDATDPDKGMSVVRKVLDEQEDEQEPNNALLVLNKLDLLNATMATNDGSLFAKQINLDDSPDDTIFSTFEISCETNQGIDHFLDALTERVLARVSIGNDISSKDSAGEEDAIITRERHRRHVEDAVSALARFESLSKQGYMAVDMAAEELRLAASELGRITGAVDVEDVLDVLFSDFCIGK